MAACFGRMAQELGRLDLLVNNAGVGRFGPIAEMSADDFDAVMDVNVRGVFLCCREAMRLMRPAQGWLHHQHWQRDRLPRLRKPGRLLCQQARGHGPDQSPGH